MIYRKSDSTNYQFNYTSSNFIILFGVFFFIVLPGIQSTPAQIPQNIIREDIHSKESVQVTNIDGDSSKDIIVAENFQVMWYEDIDGDEGKEIYSGLSDDQPQDDIYAADLDSDGDIDIASISDSGESIFWHENDGNGNFYTHTISAIFDSPKSVHAADLNGDDNVDVISVSRFDDELVWYENKGGGDFSSKRVITDQAPTPLSVYAEDIDGDGDPDIIVGGSTDFFAGNVAWYENIDGYEDYNVHEITSEPANAYAVHAADLDNDGDQDILSAGKGFSTDLTDGHLNWYENDESGNFTTHTIVGEYTNGIHTADVDSDSYLEVLSASFEDDKIAWYQNEGGSIGSQRLISEPDPDQDPDNNTQGNTDGAEDVFAADLDNDGDQDVISVSSNDEKLAWYENEDGVLPVELSKLDASTTGKRVVLSWETSSETRNSGFDILHRTPDDESWVTLAFVESKASGGTTSESNSYRYSANNLRVGTHQFRLKQVDLNGSSTLTDPVTATIRMRESAVLKAPSPNPVSSRATVSFAIKEQSRTTIQLYNALGQQVATVYQGTPQAGKLHRTYLNTTGLPSGAYFLKLKTEEKTITQQVTVLR